MPLPPPDGEPSEWCPVCDREYKQSEHNNRARAAMVYHVHQQHPEYRNLPEDDDK